MRAADGDQPFRPFRIPASVAAGPRRSRWAFARQTHPMITKTTILAFIFVTQTVCLTPTALAAESNKDFGPLTKLTPPVTVTGGRITGEGKDRNAELVVKSDSSRSISAIDVQTLLLRSDGSVSRSIPHTLAGFSGHDGRNTLDRGESYSLKVGSIFIKNDMTAVDGLVKEITFADKSTWPPMPTTPPEKKNGEPVAVMMIGVQGAGDRARAVVACFNYESKGVKGVKYEVEYLDAGGKGLKTTSYGYSSYSPIMESGAGMVVSGGDGPPDRTISVRASMTSVKFSDNSEWKRGK